MFYSLYGKARLHGDVCRAAGLFLFETFQAVKEDPRNKGLRKFGQWIKYRHELYVRTEDTDEMVDYVQSPFQTDCWGVADCEDIALKYCNNPLDLKNVTYNEPATYQAGEATIHAVVAVHGNRIWQARPDVRLYCPSGDRYIEKNNKWEIGLLDVSWICGMPHPYGKYMKGHAQDDPKYFIGADRCTEVSDVRDRIVQQYVPRKDVYAKAI